MCLFLKFSSDQIFLKTDRPTDRPIEWAIEATSRLKMCQSILNHEIAKIISKVYERINTMEYTFPESFRWKLLSYKMF